MATIGLAIKPMPFVDKVDLVKIEFKHGEKGNWDIWTTELNRFLTRKSLVLSTLIY